MSLWTSNEAVTATNGTCPNKWVATGVSIDTRSLQPGDLFVALKDVRDGHDFVAQAFEKGAAAALVSRIPDGLPETAPLLLVPDVLEGLQNLARAARERCHGRIIGVTGSVGKTSTKEMLRSALTGQGKVHAAEKSFNNHWGVPLTLARMPADTDFAIIEIGMNHPGEIGPLSRIARPHVAMVTMVAEVHMKAFKSVREIAKAKSEIFEGLEPGGSAVLNRDISTYAMVSRAAKKAQATQFRYGYAGRPEFAMKSVRAMSDSSVITYRFNREKFHFKLGAPGKHLAQNALGALAAVHAAGGDVARAAINLAGWRPPSGRGSKRIIDLGQPDVDGAILLIDESYNANPTSMAAAIEALKLSNPTDNVGRIPKGRRIAIIGDMLELGPSSVEKHVGMLAVLDGIDKVHTVGDMMKHLHHALPERQQGRHASTSDEMARQVGQILDEGDVVMVKASLGTGLAKVVSAITALGKEREQ